MKKESLNNVLAFLLRYILKLGDFVIKVPQEVK